MAALVPAVAASTLYALGVPRVMAQEVETIVVTEERRDSARQKAPSSFATVVEIDERYAPVETVGEILSESVGIQVQRYGGLGAFSTISIRGSGANQVPVFLDGIPLSQTQNQTVDLSDLPLDGLAKIEAYRGTVPIGFGGGGIGGVVNLVTREPTDQPTTDVSVGYGSFDTRKAVATHSRRIGAHTVLAHLSYLGSDGDFDYFDDNGTPETPQDDTTATRINNRLNNADLLIKSSHQLGDDTTLELLQEGFVKDQGVPGPGSTQFARPSLLNVRSLTYLRGRRQGILDDRIDATATLYGVYNLQKFKDPDGDFGRRQDTRNQTMLIGASTGGTWFAPYDQSLSWFVELAYERFFPYNATNAPLPANGPDQTRVRTTVSLQDEARLFGGRLSLVPSLRFDQLWNEFSEAPIANVPIGTAQSSDDTLWSPSIGIAARPLSGLTLRGNIGQFQRAANFSELFGNAGTVIGNAALEPETAINRDIGFVADIAGFGRAAWLDLCTIEYAYFYNNVRDLIAFDQVNARSFRAFNAGSARIRGHEVSFALSAFSAIGLDVNYTHQDSENRDVDSPEGNQLPLRPADEVFARPRVFTDWGTLYYEYTFISDNPTDSDNFAVVPSRSIHSVGFVAHPLDQLTLRLRAANITDADVRDLGDFPLPGLTIFGSMEMTF